MMELQLYAKVYKCLSKTVLVVFKIPPLTLSIVIDSKISLLLTYGFCGDHIIIQFQVVNESVNVLQRVETVPCH